MVSVGSRLFFRNGRTKGMGTVVDIVKIPSRINRTSAPNEATELSTDTLHPDLFLDEVN